MTPLWVGLMVAGAIGAPCRYLLDGLVQHRSSGALSGPGTFPWGTFLVNMTGSLLLGLITGAALYHAFPATPKIILGTGFCGAYTTFSTWAFETMRLVEEGALAKAVIYATLSLVVGLGAAGLGLALAAVL